MLAVKARKTVAVLVATLLLAAALPLWAPLIVSAVSFSSLVSEPEPRVMMGAMEVMEDDFNRATVDWTVKGGQAEAVTELSAPPYGVFEGSRSLLLTAEGTSVSLSRKPEGLTELSDVRFLMAAVYAPADGGAMSLTASLSAKDGSYEGTEALISGRWQAVFFDLSEAVLSGKATALKLTFSAEKEGAAFLLDLVGGGADAQDPFTLRYLAPSYRAEGCQLSTQDPGSMAVTVMGGGQYIEAENPALTDFSGGVGIRVRLINRSSCRSLTLRYTTLSAPEYTEKRGLTVDIPEGEGVVSCLFPLPESYVGRFRIEFDGYCQGQMEILSVSAVPCYTGMATAGSLSECVISKSRDTLSVKGQIRAEDVARYAECTLYLYELDLWEELSAVTTARPAIAETTLNGTSFSFSAALSEGREELYRKYAVMIYYDGALVPVGSPRFIANPEALATDNQVHALPSRKGYWPLTGDYLFDGLSATTVEIRLDELISLGADALSHTVGEATCTLDPAYVDTLDKQMKEYESCGVQTYFLLRVALTDDLSLNRLLCHPDATGGQYAAFHTASEEGVYALRAACDFLIKRYGTPSGVTDNLIGFVVGSSVNDAARHYHLGNVTLTGLAKQYGNALRVVYNTVRSVAAGTEVYLPLGGDWYSAMTTGQTTSFDARSTLEAVAAYLKASGDIDWDVSYDLCPGKGHYAWEIAAPTLTAEADRITAANAEVLIRHLEEATLQYNGFARSVLFLETEPRDAEDENERIRLSADYVYTYLRLASRTFASVRALIPSHPVDYNEALTYIDTNRFTEVTAFAAELIGGDRFRALLSDAAAVIDRYVNETKAVTVIPSAVKGETTLFDFTDGTAGWYGALHCAALKGGTTLDGRRDWLSVRLAPADRHVWRGIAVDFEEPLDLSKAPYLGFTCRPAVLPEGVDTLELAVVVTCGKNRQISTLTIEAGADTTVVVDLTSLPGRSACDGMAIYVRGANDTDPGEPTLLVGSVRVMSDRFEGKELEEAIRPHQVEEELPAVTLTTVITVAAIGLLALVAEGIRLRRRRQTKETDL